MVRAGIPQTCFFVVIGVTRIPCEIAIGRETDLITLRDGFQGVLKIDMLIILMNNVDRLDAIAHLSSHLNIHSLARL